jgi:hypothetical protein
MYSALDKVMFPEPRDLWINMMPIVMGDWSTIPSQLDGYLGMIDECQFPKGDVVYVSVRESYQKRGTFQSRPGLHTEATSDYSWGGWGGRQINEGIYMASTDGSCYLHNELQFTNDKQGAIEYAHSSAIVTEPNRMYWLTDRTPHCNMPAFKDGIRQWFRLVSNKVGAWYTKHSTPNPLGVKPTCLITDEDKFN